MDQRTVEQLIEHVLRRSGRANFRPQDIEFYHAAFLSERLNWRDIRKIGQRLTSEEVRALGENPRTILTREFVDTLNEVGRDSPTESGSLICCYMNNLLQSRRRLLAQSAAGIDHATLMPSEMLAGPCAKASQLRGVVIPHDRIELLPFDECDHPDQCGCLYRSHLTWED